MSDIDIRNYGRVIEDLGGTPAERERPREAIKSVLLPEEQGMAVPVIQRGEAKYYSEALVDRLLEENYRQQLSIKDYRETFEETDNQVANLLLRLGIVFAVILAFAVFIVSR